MNFEIGIPREGKAKMETLIWDFKATAMRDTLVVDKLSLQYIENGSSWGCGWVGNGTYVVRTT